MPKKILGNRSQILSCFFKELQKESQTKECKDSFKTLARYFYQKGKEDKDGKIIKAIVTKIN